MMAIAGPSIARSRRLPEVGSNLVAADRVDFVRSGPVRSTVPGRGTRHAGLAPKSDNQVLLHRCVCYSPRGYRCNRTRRYPTLGPGHAACHGLRYPARGELPVSGSRPLGRGSSHRPSPSRHRNRPSPCQPAMLRRTIQAASYRSSYCSTSHPDVVPVPSPPNCRRVLTPRQKTGGFSPPPPSEVPAGEAGSKTRLKAKPKAGVLGGGGRPPRCPSARLPA